MSSAIDTDLLLAMAHSPLHNYAGAPGLTSYLLGNPGPTGCVRLFSCQREHEEAITPHSHRFDFECLVLRGSVRNHVWRPGGGDPFAVSRMKYLGTPGQFEREAEGTRSYIKHSLAYSAGQTYRMRHDAIHSINFSRGALVLFFEGPQRADSSVILEPWVNGERVPTFETREWMFKAETSAKGGE